MLMGAKEGEKALSAAIKRDKDLTQTKNDLKLKEGYSQVWNRAFYLYHDHHQVWSDHTHPIQLKIKEKPHEVIITQNPIGESARNYEYLIKYRPVDVPPLPDDPAYWQTLYHFQQDTCTDRFRKPLEKKDIKNLNRDFDFIKAELEKEDKKLEAKQAEREKSFNEDFVYDSGLPLKQA